MTSIQLAQLPIEALALEFFQNSAGKWHSQRRYYTLKQDVEPQEVVSLIEVRFIEAGAPELIHLAKLHKFEDATVLIGGSQVSWESNYTGKSRKPSKGSTIFGILGDTLYRDRGFATADPVTANYFFPNPRRCV